MWNTNHALTREPKGARTFDNLPCPLLIRVLHVRAARPQQRRGDNISSRGRRINKQNEVRKLSPVRQYDAIVRSPIPRYVSQDQ